MKKLLNSIICFMLVIALVGCDKNTPDEKEQTPEDKIPMSETVTFEELIKKEDVAYIKYGTFIFLDLISPENITYDVDAFFGLIMDPNTELEFVYDIEGVYDLYDYKAEEVFDYIREGDRFLAVDFYNKDGRLIGELLMYQNNTIAYSDYSNSEQCVLTYYISIDYADISIKEIVDAIDRGDWIK